MSAITHLVYILGFVVLILVVIFGALVKTLLRVRLKEGGCELHKRSEVPEYLKGLFDSYETQLVGLGFVFSHCQLFDEPVVTSHSRRWNLVYVNPEKGCYANVSVSLMPEQAMPVKIELVSYFSDGHKLVTVNGTAHDTIGEIPNVTLIDRYAESLEQQFEGHIEELSRLRQDRTLVLVDPEGYVQSEKAAVDDYISSLEKKGFIKEAKEGGWQFRFMPALKHVIKVLAGQNKVKTMRSRIQRHLREQGLSVADIPIEAETQAFLRTKELMAPKRTGFAGKMGVFLASLLIFILVFRISFDVRAVLILALAIGLHELGHVLGMRLFHYKDVQVLFLPFGAATIGSDQKATAMQRIIIYLLGPAPGILLGTCFLLLDQIYDIAFLRDFGLFLLVLNYLNMLPIFPLDGGRVVDLALFSRCQVLKVLFLIFSVFLLALAAVFSRDPILTGFAVILGLSIFPQIQKSRAVAKLKKKIRDEQLEVSDEVIVPEIFKMMKEKPYRKLSFSKKFTMAKGLLAGVSSKPPTIGVSIASMFMYGAVFLLPLVVVIIWVVSVVFIGTGAHYAQGIVDFVPSPDSEYVFVTRMKNIFTNSGLVLDKNGGLVVDCGKGVGFLNPELTWRPGPEKGWVLYRKGAALRGLAGAPKDKPGMMLYNIDTHDVISIKHPKVGAEDCHIDYVKWSDDGSCLFGTETDVSKSDWRLRSIFRHNVISGKFGECEIPQSGPRRSVRKLLPAQNKVILRTEYEEDTEKQRFTILDMGSCEEEPFKFEEGVTQWEIAADGRALIVLGRVFGDNVVRYRLAIKDIEGDDERVLMESPILPQYTFEDAARGKAVYVSFQISPMGKWVVCNSTAEDRQGTYWLVNPSEGGFSKLLKWDSDKYYVSIAFSPDETKLGALYSSTEYRYDPNESDVTKVEIYNIKGTEPDQTAVLEIDEEFSGYKFFGNEHLLYIKSSNEDSKWQNTDELWMINITDGSQEPFVRIKSSVDE